MRRIFYLSWAEVLHIVRDRATLMQVIIGPLIQLLLLGSVATFSIHNIPMTVTDFDHTPSSRELISHFAASKNFSIIGQTQSLDVVNEQMLRGTITMALTIPHDFEKDLVRTGSAQVEVSVNAEKGAAAGLVVAYASRIFSQESADLGSELRPTNVVVQSQSEPSPPPIRVAPHFDVQERYWYNPTLNYRHYMVPGILVLIVTVFGTLLTAQNIAREKELGTLEQLNVTPITRFQFIAGKLLPLWGFVIADLVVGLIAGHLIFGMPINGNPILLLICGSLYFVVALSIGLIISTVVDTQQQAMFVTFFTLMVYNLMSGLFTPIDSMPQWIQDLSLLNPVRHFVTISRALLVKGAGLSDIATPLLALVGFAAVTLPLAIRQYKKRNA